MRILANGTYKYKAYLFDRAELSRVFLTSANVGELVQYMYLCKDPIPTPLVVRTLMLLLGGNGTYTGKRQDKEKKCRTV